jgi:glycosyltransferase involved in cell wall biosynthesis
MKPVLHVIPSVAPRDGGPSAAVAGMCQALERAGVPTLVATTDADGAGRLDVPLDYQTAFAGMRVRFFPCQFSERFKYSRPLSAWLRRHVDEFTAVHVHAVFSHASIAAGHAARRTATPYVVRPLGTIDPWSLAQHGGRKRALMWFGAKALLEGAGALQYTADEEQRRAERAMSWLPRGVVVPLGVDERLFTVGPADDARWQGPVLVLARLHPKKGIDLAIQAFHRVAQHTTDRRLVIAGDGDETYVRELRALAAHGPAAARIDFVGWVQSEQRAQLLRTASVFVLPSVQENFGLSMIEAMAAGAPVIVTNTIDLASQVVGAGAGWVVERSVEGVADALLESITSPAECRSRGARARRLAEGYRWSAIGDRLKTLYMELASAQVPVHVQASFFANR